MASRCVSRSGRSASTPPKLARQRELPDSHLAHTIPQRRGIDENLSHIARRWPFGRRRLQPAERALAGATGGGAGRVAWHPGRRAGLPVGKQLLAGTSFAAAYRDAKCAPHLFGVLIGA